MSKSTLPRLKALRDEMGKAGITAFIIPGTDPHQSEYYASHWAARTWISGFDGSAGTAVVTTNQAGLWTDSVRLHLGKTPIDPQKRSLYSR